jgi:hypothetical protein
MAGIGVSTERIGEMLEDEGLLFSRDDELLRVNWNDVAVVMGWSDPWFVVRAAWRGDLVTEQDRMTALDVIAEQNRSHFLGKSYLETEGADTAFCVDAHHFAPVGLTDPQLRLAVQGSLTTIVRRVHQLTTRLGDLAGRDTPTLPEGLEDLEDLDPDPVLPVTGERIRTYFDGAGYVTEALDGAIDSSAETRTEAPVMGVRGIFDSNSIVARLDGDFLLVSGMTMQGRPEETFPFAQEWAHRANETTMGTCVGALVDPDDDLVYLTCDISEDVEHGLSATQLEAWMDFALVAVVSVLDDYEGVGDDLLAEDEPGGDQSGEDHRGEDAP